MTALNLLNLFALSSLAILALSSGATPGNALSVDQHNVARYVAREHSVLAKKRTTKRDTKRCKPRPAPPKPQTPSDPGSGGYGGSSPPPYKAPPSPPPAPAPAPPPPSGGGKLGVAWPNGDDQALRNFKIGRAHYLYTWSPSIPNLARQLGFTPMAMLWGWNQVGDFSKLVHSGYANIALGMNEPNERGQSNMDPGSGAALWRQYIAPLRHQGYRLGSPSTSSAPSGFTWMNDFLRICPDCNWDFTTVHYYDVSVDGFIAYINKFHNAFGRNVMVTEYACQNFNGGAQCSKDQTFNFHMSVKGYMEGQSWVEAYFPFGVMHNMQDVNPTNQLMSGGGQPTDLYRAYAN